MTDRSRKPGGPARPANSTREERLKAALKANIQRRKAQARERDSGAGAAAGDTAAGTRNDNNNET